MSVGQRDLVREVVAEVAPHELTVLDGLESVDDQTVTRILSRRRTRRDPVGFGVAEVTALVTPVVWLAVDEVVRRSAGEAAAGLLARARAWLRKLFRRPARPRHTSVPTLTPAQLRQVHHQIIARAEAAGIERETATTLADAVISRIARGAAATPCPRPEPDAAAG